MRITQPTPTNPYCPTACGPSSHSPLPIEMPSAMRLGPSAYMNSSRGPILADTEDLFRLGQVLDGEWGTADA